jgi:hypothetical protein
MPKANQQRNQVSPVRPASRGGAEKTEKAREVNWSGWWPFDRATGDALRQLNRKPKLEEPEEALL